MVSDFHGKNPEEEVERFDKKKKKIYRKQIET